MMDNEVVEVRKHNYVVPASVAGLTAFAVPALAFAEGEPATVSSAINGMATTVVTDGTAMLTSLIPTLAPLIAAVAVATLGIKLFKRFKNAA